MMFRKKCLLLISLLLILSACGGSTKSSGSGDTTANRPSSLFQWLPTKGATQYELGYEKQGDTAWHNIVKSSSVFGCQTGHCSFSPKNFPAGTNIDWWVRAYVPNSWKKWSTTKHATVGKGNASGDGSPPSNTDKQAPTAPTKLTVDKVTEDTASFTWNASSDNVKVTAYHIYRGGTFLSSTTATSYKDESVVENTTYKYQVKAIDASGNESLASNSLSLTTKQAGLTGINEPSGIYDTDNNVLQMSVKIFTGSGQCEVDQYDGCTFGQVLNDINWKDDFKPEVKAELTTENGFSADATFRQRGGRSRFNPMKSFRVKLSKNSAGKKVYWEGERRIQLLKTFDDLTRARHKLSYDLFAEVDHLPSMRSRFVRLKVEDKGEFNFARNPDYSPLSGYKETDMGLYLQVEYFGKEYLERRKWKKDSGIYKASDFSFEWDDETQSAFSLDDKGKPYDKKAFEKKLEIKSGKDHRELINLMDAIHDTSNDFNEDVLGEYLDRKNYITWLAVNILTANTDTVAHNYYLYNPKGSKKFFFVPWDYDFAYNGPDIVYGPNGRISLPKKPPYWYTHAFRWGNALHERFLEDPSNVVALKQRVIALQRSVFSDSNIRAKLNSYKSTIDYLVTSDIDDQWGLYRHSSQSVRLAAYSKEMDDLAKNVQSNYRNYLKYYDSPMPFYMDTAEVKDGEFSMSWGDSVSLQGNDLSYDLIISRTSAFSSDDILEEITDISSHKFRMGWSHGSGQFFVKIIARDSQGNWQSAENDYEVKDGNGILLYLLYGIDDFTVN